MAKSKSIRKSSRPEPAPKPDLADILGRFTDAHGIFMCVARALTERQDPHDASEPRALIGDELITLQQGIAMLNAAIKALDLVRS